LASEETEQVESSVRIISWMCDVKMTNKNGMDMFQERTRMIW